MIFLWCGDDLWYFLYALINYRPVFLQGSTIASYYMSFVPISPLSTCHIGVGWLHSESCYECLNFMFMFVVGFWVYLYLLVFLYYVTIVLLKVLYVLILLSSLCVCVGLVHTNNFGQPDIAAALITWPLRFYVVIVWQIYTDIFK